MLQTTLELIEYLDKKTPKREATIVRSLVAAIFKCGSLEDAEALFDLVKTRPLDSYITYLFPVFEKYGDTRLAAKIYEVFFGADQFMEVPEPEVLELLGKLKYEKAKPLLVRYAFNDSDYYLSKHAVLGLLHFECDELQQVIENQIEKTYGKNLFPEFVPALAGKLHNRKNMLEKLYDSGTTYCSTDCNAGIILGFSLCGAEGLKYFRKALFDPAWEISAGSSGTVYYAYQGLIHQGITFSELYQHIRQFADQEQLSYGLRVLFSLLEVKIKDQFSIRPHPESFSSIYLSLYGWENEHKSNNITDISTRVNLDQEAYRIEELLEMKVYEESLLKACTR